MITSKPTTKAEEEALAKEAEQVYRAFVKEQSRLESKGGVKGKLPASLTKYISGKELARQETIMNALHSQGIRTEFDGPLVVRAEPAVFAGLGSGHLVSMTFCNDGSNARMVARDGSSTPGRNIQYIAMFKRDEQGILKINSSETRTVEKCAG
ncbi:hypothetical protein M3G03_05460 [Aestuariimicrobium sp. p3-SID1156]|uniref:hypothetical protein n=1 Tax=Aestuariimicrobium sp. p3-SID1156 TaxID=2916038 RepID=UPI00223B1BFA|nr:hypothetical protein [Aestuariimicrobium sp. p3-SID1156]MCT1458990.1 hypothetical protein [Aestuariimicrobium sp. p3-SID1156]